MSGLYDVVRVRLKVEGETSGRVRLKVEGATRKEGEIGGETTLMCGTPLRFRGVISKDTLKGITYLARAPLRLSLSRYTSCPATLARSNDDSDD